MRPVMHAILAVDVVSFNRIVGSFRPDARRTDGSPIEAVESRPYKTQPQSTWSPADRSERIADSFGPNAI